MHGAIVGGLTAVVALGMALTYRTNRIINFAHADLGTTPLVLSAMLTTAWGWPWLAATGTGVVAALTAQNTHGVTGVHGVPPPLQAGLRAGLLKLKRVPS